MKIGPNGEKMYSLEEVKARLELVYERSSKRVAPEARKSCSPLVVLKEAIDIVQRAIDGDSSELDAIVNGRRAQRWWISRPNE